MLRLARLSDLFTELLFWSNTTSGRFRPLSGQRKQALKNITSFVLAASLAFSASTAFAGGPVVVEEEGNPEVVAESPRSGWIVPVIIGGIILCAIACGDDDETTSTTITVGEEELELEQM
jgi:hypothetical protein